jgi:Kdo2-lipid IVA lauroyltransferase/acyltransferase
MVKKKRFSKRLKNGLIYYATKFGLKCLLAMDRSQAFTFFEWLGHIGYYIALSERKKTITHLTMIFGNQKSPKEIREMAKRVFVNLTRNMVDAFRLGKLRGNTIDSIVSIQGLEKLDHALAKGKGVLALTGHLGNWELLGAYLALKGYPLNVIGARSYDPRIDELIIQNRQVAGAHYIARGSATREILRALKRKETIGLLIDQDSKHFDGVFVDFMGKEAFTPVGPVQLAMKTGAALIVMTIHLKPDFTHKIETSDEIELTISSDQEQDLVSNTLKCSKVIEHYILKHPTQWVWMHKRWKTKRKYAN